MKSRLICAVLLTVTACGCAYVKTDVRALDLLDALSGERTYSLARTASQETDPDDWHSEVVVQEELRKYGFLTEPVDRAHYLLLPSFETRLATIGTYADDCEATNDSCQSDGTSPIFHLFGGNQYRHSLTLRFFELTSGQEVYKVTATNLDRNADHFHAVGYLVRSALTRFAHGGKKTGK